MRSNLIWQRTAGVAALVGALTDFVFHGMQNLPQERLSSTR